MKPRALVIAPFMNTSMSSDRPMQFALELSKYAAVDIVTAAFCHHRKINLHKSIDNPNIHIYSFQVPAYFSNVSIARVWSHIVFMWRAAAWLLRCKKQYKIIYCTAPFGLLAYYVFRKLPHAARILDVVDLWPGSLPFPHPLLFLMSPIFRIWRKINIAAAEHSNYVASGSNTYLGKLRSSIPGSASPKFCYVQIKSNNPTQEQPLRNWNGGALEIAYIGNMGSLIDWESLLEISSLSGCSVSLSLIGDGDRRVEICRELDRRGIRYRYYGIVFDQHRLMDILRPCHFGYNGYRNTDASFSYKASTYIDHALPIINSMQGELWSQIERHNSGINFSKPAEVMDALGALTQEGYSNLISGISNHRKMLSTSNDLNAFVQDIVMQKND